MYSYTDLINKSVIKYLSIYIEKNVFFILSYHNFLMLAVLNLVIIIFHLVIQNFFIMRNVMEQYVENLY